MRADSFTPTLCHWPDCGCRLEASEWSTFGCREFSCPDCLEIPRLTLFDPRELTRFAGQMEGYRHPIPLDPFDRFYSPPSYRHRNLDVIDSYQIPQRLRRELRSRRAWEYEHDECVSIARPIPTRPLECEPERCEAISIARRPKRLPEPECPECRDPKRRTIPMDSDSWRLSMSPSAWVTDYRKASDVVSIVRPRREWLSPDAKPARPESEVEQRLSAELRSVKP